MSQLSDRRKELAQTRTRRTRSNPSSPSLSAGPNFDLSSVPDICSRGDRLVKRDMDKAITEQIAKVRADVARSIEDVLSRLRAEFEERLREEIHQINVSVERALMVRAERETSGSNRRDTEVTQTITSHTNALRELRTDVNSLLEDLRGDRDHVDSQFSKVASRLPILETQDPQDQSYRPSFLGNPLRSQ